MSLRMLQQHAHAHPIPENDYRARFVRFYERYNPEKLKDVDDLMTRYSYDLPGVITAMVDKYGPEPGPVAPPKKTPGAPQPQQAQQAAPATPVTPKVMIPSTPTVITAQPVSNRPIPEHDYRARIVRYYQKYNPEKLSEVDVLMQRYANDLPAVMVAMKNKYGPEPGPVTPAGTVAPPTVAPGPSTPASPQTLVTPATPHQVKVVHRPSTSITSHDGSSSHMPQPSLGQVKVIHRPSTTSDGGSTLGGTTGSASPPMVRVVHQPSPSTMGLRAIPEHDYRARIVRYYQKYNPEKLSEVDSLMQRYANDLPGVMKAMLNKYGPEPGPVSPAAAAAPAPQQGGTGLITSAVTVTPPAAVVGQAPPPAASNVKVIHRSVLSQGDDSRPSPARVQGNTAAAPAAATSALPVSAASSTTTTTVTAPRRRFDLEKLKIRGSSSDDDDEGEDVDSESTVLRHPAPQTPAALPPAAAANALATTTAASTNASPTKMDSMRSFHSTVNSVTSATMMHPPSPTRTGVVPSNDSDSLPPMQREGTSQPSSPSKNARANGDVVGSERATPAATRSPTKQRQSAPASKPASPTKADRATERAAAAVAEHSAAASRASPPSPTKSDRHTTPNTATTRSGHASAAPSPTKSKAVADPVPHSSTPTPSAASPPPTKSILKQPSTTATVAPTATAAPPSTRSAAVKKALEERRPWVESTHVPPPPPRKWQSQLDEPADLENRRPSPTSAVKPVTSITRGRTTTPISREATSSDEGSAAHSRRGGGAMDAVTGTAAATRRSESSASRRAEYDDQLRRRSNSGDQRSKRYEQGVSSPVTVSSTATPRGPRRWVSPAVQREEQLAEERRARALRATAMRRYTSLVKAGLEDSDLAFHARQDALREAHVDPMAYTSPRRNPQQQQYSANASRGSIASPDSVQFRSEDGGDDDGERSGGDMIIDTADRVHVEIVQHASERRVSQAVSRLMEERESQPFRPNIAHPPDLREVLGVPKDRLRCAVKLGVPVDRHSYIPKTDHGHADDGFFTAPVRSSSSMSVAPGFNELLAPYDVYSTFKKDTRPSPWALATPPLTTRALKRSSSVQLNDPFLPPGATPMISDKPRTEEEKAKQAALCQRLSLNRRAQQTIRSNSAEARVLEEQHRRRVAQHGRR